MKLILCALLVSGCASARVAVGSGQPPTRKADFEDHLDYYAFGFSGDASVDLQRVCMEQRAQAAQKIRTFEDGLLTALTLGVYAPLTVRVWCE